MLKKRKTIQIYLLESKKDLLIKLRKSTRKKSYEIAEDAVKKFVTKTKHGESIILSKKNRGKNWTQGKEMLGIEIEGEAQESLNYLSERDCIACNRLLSEALDIYLDNFKSKDLKVLKSRREIWKIQGRMQLNIVIDKKLWQRFKEHAAKLGKNADARLTEIIKKTLGE